MGKRTWFNYIKSNRTGDRVKPGDRFGDLQVTQLRASRTPAGNRVWRCRCSCGNETEVETRLLISGNTRSCGKHRDLGGLSSSPEYSIWRAMIRRCHDERDPAFHNYGGRGIRVCARWRESFLAFIEDVGRRPSSELTLDRIDNDGNYERDNVRWATRRTQSRNKRGALRAITANGITKPLVVWAEEIGISRQALAQRLKGGWSPERAATAPLDPSMARR